MTERCVDFHHPFSSLCHPLLTVVIECLGRVPWDQTALYSRKGRLSFRNNEKMEKLSSSIPSFVSPQIDRDDILILVFPLLLYCPPFRSLVIDITTTLIPSQTVHSP
jgi:hypothetical protein